MGYCTSFCDLCIFIIRSPGDPCRVMLDPDLRPVWSFSVFKLSVFRWNRASFPQSHYCHLISPTSLIFLTVIEVPKFLLPPYHPLFLQLRSMSHFPSGFLENVLQDYKPDVIFMVLMNCIGYQCLQRTALVFRSLIPIYFIELINISTIHLRIFVLNYSCSFLKSNWTSHVFIFFLITGWQTFK